MCLSSYIATSIPAGNGDDAPSEAVLTVIPPEPFEARGDWKHRSNSDFTTLLAIFQPTVTTRSNPVAIEQACNMGTGLSGIQEIRFGAPKVLSRVVSWWSAGCGGSPILSVGASNGVRGSEASSPCPCHSCSTTLFLARFCQWLISTLLVVWAKAFRMLGFCTRLWICAGTSDRNSNVAIKSDGS